MHNSLYLLGLRCRDKVTGMEGIVTSITFDLYGCIQAILHPGLDSDGKVSETFWFDQNRLEIVNDNPVMDRPDFGFDKGPAERPKCMRTV